MVRLVDVAAVAGVGMFAAVARGDNARATAAARAPASLFICRAVPDASCTTFNIAAAAMYGAATRLLLTHRTCDGSGRIKIGRGGSG
jgi:hypothetical protein